MVCQVGSYNGIYLDPKKYAEEWPPGRFLEVLGYHFVFFGGAR